ncbi:uncharacterized protein LOC108906589 [Anoplophora glabripennis]|uniref:uncharacterized protein LOC108906589 n=1 Tax=Anoplophora glabripennis TaxID=217634 RepID=UPI000874FFB6|nr:uncharacterized protein LOC108906589 [Anoplophora glabripennis]
MWSIVNSMGNPAHNMGAYKSQKREFSLSVEKVPIVPGKTFSNPNFVIKHHPSIHSHRNNFIPIPVEKFSHTDSSNTSSKPQNTNSALKNSSQSLVDTLKKHHLDTIKSPEIVETSPAQPMCSKKRSKRNRKNRRRRTPDKNTNTRNYIKDMMDVEIDLDTSLSYTDISVSPKMPHTTFNLTDFIVNKPCKIPKAATCTNNEYDTDEDEFVATIISVSPSNVNRACMRERQVSVSESEDSFIVFNDRTDEGLESSEESESESEDEWEETEDEGEDEVDFASPAIPIKRVRFAGDEELCQVHNMVQWSFAYQQARKGPWEEYARDRDRFSRKVADIEKILTPVFDAAHRSKVYRERFKDRTFKK